MSCRILIADDQVLFREGLAELLKKEPDFEVIGYAGDGLEAIDAAEKLKADLIITEIDIPKLDGIDAAIEIYKKNKNIKIIILSKHTEKKYILESFAGGACAYLCKGCEYEEVLRGIRAVLAGQNYITSFAATTIINEYFLNGETKNSNNSNLDHREKEIVQMLSEGKSSKEIAVFLNISNKTVDSLKRQIMKKTGINSVAELTKYAINEGLTTLDY